MGAKSAIEWTHHTFNPWRGWTKISSGCANWYAETQSRRNPKTLGVWGDKWTRVVAAESYWRLPRTWDRWAAEGVCPHCGGKSVRDTPGKCEECDGTGKHPGGPYRARVFCASLADVFEDRAELDKPRARLLGVILDTPHLDWLLLTKRPESIRRLLGRAWNVGASVPGPFFGAMVDDWLRGRPPANVWLGTSVEDQQLADERIPHLLRCPAAVRFLSCEPLLGAVDLTRVDAASIDADAKGIKLDALRGGRKSATPWHVGWVIVGGESGPGARPCDVAWVRSIVGQCREAGVPCFVKQLGANSVSTSRPHPGVVLTARAALRSSKGGDPAEWAEDLRAREFPRAGEVGNA